MKKISLTLIVTFFFHFVNANAGLYIDGFGYASKYQDGTIHNLLTGKEEIESHRGGGFGASFGVAKKFEDVIYLGLEVTSLSIGDPTILDLFNFKFGFSIGDFSAYLLGGFSFFSIVEGAGIEYIVKKGAKESDSKSKSVAIFSEYKRYNHLFDDPTHIVKVGMRLYF